MFWAFGDSALFIFGAGGLAILTVVYVVHVYNSLIRSRNGAKNSFSSIDTILQNRLDIIPNLVEVVKQYVKHEQEVILRATEIRSKILQNQDASSETRFTQENALSGTLKSLFAVSEAYPDLKADQNFLQLQNSWFSIEEEIAASRRSYNASVTDYEDLRQSFPALLVAACMKLETFALFEASIEARTPPSAKQLFSAE